MILAAPFLTRIAIGAGIIALLSFLLWLYGHSKYLEGRNEERAKWEAAQQVADKEILRLNVALVTSQLTAMTSYQEKLSAQEPIILHDRQTIERFAATPAGAVQCLDPDRVRGIEDAAAERGLAHPASTGSSGSAVHVSGPSESR